MTLVSALSGHQGVAMFADTQETVSGYSKKIVNKLHVVEFLHAPFRIGIAGATNDATYVDALQSEIIGGLSKVPKFDLSLIGQTLTATLTDFYSKHIWRRPDRPQMEYLLTVQPLPVGRPEVFHISETASNVLGVTTHWKSIGIGAFLADYLISRVLGGGEGLFELGSASVYVAQEVRENIDGVGQVEGVSFFDSNGGYDELDMVDILALEQNLQHLNEGIGSSFGALEISGGTNWLEATTDGIASSLAEMRENQELIYRNWLKRQEGRARLQEIYAKHGRRA